MWQGDARIEPGNSPLCTKDLRQTIDEKSGKDTVSMSAIPPELAQVVALWPALPEAVRKAIVTMVQVVGKRE